MAIIQKSTSSILAGWKYCSHSRLRYNQTGSLLCASSAQSTVKVVTYLLVFVHLSALGVLVRQQEGYFTPGIPSFCRRTQPSLSDHVKLMFKRKLKVVIRVTIHMENLEKSGNLTLSSGKLGKFRKIVLCLWCAHDSHEKQPEYR